MENEFEELLKKAKVNEDTNASNNDPSMEKFATGYFTQVNYTYLFIYLLICLFVCLSICLSVCLFVNYLVNLIIYFDLVI